MKSPSSLLAIMCQEVEIIIIQGQARMIRDMKGSKSAENIERLLGTDSPGAG